MKDITISEAVRYVGVDDKTIDLFEGQYKVPNGVSYNSYVILDEKIAIMDTWTSGQQRNGSPTWKQCWTAKSLIIWSSLTWSPTTLEACRCWRKNIRRWS